MKILLFLLLPFFAISQDTTIKVTVPYSFKVERVVTGTRTLIVTLPKPKKDTVYIHDTIFVNTCTPQPSSGLKWSEQTGTFQQFIDSAIATGRTAIIDKPVQPANTVVVKGDLKINGRGNLITNTLPVLFHLWDGVHVFDSINILQTNLQGIAFYTEPRTGARWTNTISNLTILGGKDGYASARGGDSANWCGTTITNAVIKIHGGCAIGIFAQDGPYKYLHLRNVQMRSDTTHNLYCHPNVSLDFDSVHSIFAGE